MKIPFTIEQFFEVFELYNDYWYPFQFVWLFLSIIGLFMINKKTKFARNYLIGLLSSLWIWSGMAFHWLFFSTINPIAYAFGGLFVLQGLFF